MKYFFSYSTDVGFEVSGRDLIDFCAENSISGLLLANPASIGCLFATRQLEMILERKVQGIWIPHSSLVFDTEFEFEESVKFQGKYGKI